MYLIHVRLHTPRDFQVPEDLAAQFIAEATPAESVEHVSVHPGDEALTLGLYVVAESLLIAEQVALVVARRTVARLPTLSGSRITSCSAAIIAAYFDRTLERPGGDGRTMRLPNEDTAES
ncbi:hypothetical protein [Streptomyces sp. SUK 48]|uniref:hypothetical protein n=1 Tax=Streptomyces sp. SUK 48 TaxID=2582831 RepID=UPI00129B5D5A|nr:hypothetical protein [Streptomyces sp. SUK 48]